MRPRTPTEEWRSGVRLIEISAVLVVIGLGLFWLVMNTNPSGNHDAELIPALMAIPASVGIYRLIHSRTRA